MADQLRARILVTGGSGFIGTNVIDHYLGTGAELLNLDIKPPRNKNHQSVWREVDILDLPNLRAAVITFNPTHVLHLAARTDLDERQTIDGYGSNIKGVENIISVLEECHGLKRVIFTSSMLVCRVGYNPTNYDDYSPPNLYGESKVLTEKIVKAGDIKRYEWLLIRPTSIWGPWFGSPYRDFFDRIKSKAYVKISGKSSTKTFGFVYNAVHQIDKLLFSADKTMVNKKTFYIGDKPALNINDWADIIASQLNIRLFTVPHVLLKVGGWFGDILLFFNVKFPLQSFRVKNMTTDNVIDLLSDTVAVVPENPYSVEEGVRITLEWMNEHK